MKRVPYLTGITLGLFTLATGARADSLPSEPPVNPYIETDGDGIPLAVLHPPPVKPTAEQVEAARKSQAKAEADKNWLIRGYEDRLKANAANDPTQSQDSNLYYELSQNKELAKLAGIVPADADNSTTDQLQTTDQTSQTAAQSSDTSTQSESHAAAAASPLKSQYASVFDLKPLITSSSQPNSEGFSNFYATPPAASRTAPAADTSADSEQSADSMDLESPGMTAAKNDPASGLDTPDLTLDVLPGETIEQAKANRANNNSLELPQPMNVQQLHSTLPTAASLNALPTLPSPTKATAIVIPVAQPAPTQAEPPSFLQHPVVMPVHAGIANPYDILNR